LAFQGGPTYDLSKPTDCSEASPSPTFRRHLSSSASHVMSSLPLPPAYNNRLEIITAR
jgi:hypothetical protein